MSVPAENVRKNNIQPRVHDEGVNATRDSCGRSCHSRHFPPIELSWLLLGSPPEPAVTGDLVTILTGIPVLSQVANFSVFSFFILKKSFLHT